MVISLVKYATGILGELRSLIYYLNCEAQAATINCAYGRCILPQQFTSTEQPSRAVFLTTTARRIKVQTNDFARSFLSIVTVRWCSDSPIFARLTYFLRWIMTTRPLLAKYVLRLWVYWRADNATTTTNDKKPVCILSVLPCFYNKWAVCLFSLELRHTSKYNSVVISKSINGIQNTSHLNVNVSVQRTYITDWV